MFDAEQVSYPFDLNEPGAVEGLLAFHRQLSGGMRMMADEDDGDDGEDDGDDEDLIDGAGGDDGGDDDGDGDGDDDGDSGQDSQAKAFQRMLDAAVEKIQQQTTSEIDRRINQLSKRQKSGSQQQQDRQSQQRSGPDPADLREGRMVYREEIASLIRLSGPERELASEIARSAVRRAVVDGKDPEEAGRAAARQVAEKVRGLRKHHQSAVVDGLVKRGVLDRNAIRPGQQQGVSGGKKPDSMKQYQSGQTAAQQLLKRRGLITESDE